MKLLSTIYQLKNIKELSVYADGFLVGNEDFGTRLTQSFSKPEIIEALNITKKLNKSLFLVCNQMFTDQMLDSFKLWIEDLPIREFSGIIVADLGAYKCLESMGLSEMVIYNPETLLANVYDFNSNKIISVKETQKLFPKNYYGQTKLIIERYLNNKFDSCYILRLFNIAGYVNKDNFYEFKNKYRRILPVINEAFRKKLTFKINLIKSKGKAVFPGRDFVHIKDFLEIIFLIIKKQSANNLILNVGNNKLVHLNEIINVFEKKLKRKIDFKKIISTKGNLNYTLCNNALIKKKLKFNFKFNLSKIVKSCINKKII